VARQKPADAAKAKAAKQKKMVIALSVVLVLAMGYAVKTMKSMGGGPAAAPVEATTSVTPNPNAPQPAAASPVATAAAPTLAGAALGALPATSTSVPTADLVSAVRPAAATGQLQSFSRFYSKDPFAGGAGSSPATTTTTTTSSGSGSSGSGGAASPPPAVPAPPTPPVTSAVISINGVGESVAAGGAFPAASPMFQLVSLTAKTAKISVVGGSYATGAPTLTLTVNKPLTLQNTADGTKFTILLLPQGTAAPAAPTTSGAAPAPAAPTSTTPSSTGG
jgi:hypothetical protein